MFAFSPKQLFLFSSVINKATELESCDENMYRCTFAAFPLVEVTVRSRCKAPTPEREKKSLFKTVRSC